ncbi:hypothetical protein VTN96DRAFT_1035 [Rasamsonia emersonii]
MSGPGDDRWRGGRPYEQNRQPAQRNPALGRTMGSQGGSRGGHSSNPSNAWGGPREQQVPAGPPQEQHVPVRGFNATESKNALKRDPSEPKPAIYKPTTKEPTNSRASGPWASKPNTMANGKDFFLELRKQVSALQQGGSIPGG